MVPCCRMRSADCAAIGNLATRRVAIPSRHGRGLQAKWGRREEGQRAVAGGNGSEDRTSEAGKLRDGRYRSAGNEPMFIFRITVRRSSINQRETISGRRNSGFSGVDRIRSAKTQSVPPGFRNSCNSRIKINRWIISGSFGNCHQNSPPRTTPGSKRTSQPRLPSLILPERVIAAAVTLVYVDGLTRGRLGAVRHVNHLLPRLNSARSQLAGRLCCRVPPT
jgi:hypothetical protein